MSEQRFVKDHSYLVNYDKYCILDKVQHKHLYLDEVCEKLNEQQDTITNLQEEKEYWESKAMILLMQVRRLTPRMTDKEVKEFSKELEDD